MIMADFTASVSPAFNTGTILAFNAALATQTVDYDGIADDKVIIIVKNTNTFAAMTATVTIAPGDYLHSTAGTLSVNIAGANVYTAIGPLEGARFKNSASKVSITTAVTAPGTLSYVTVAVLKTH